MFSSEHLSLISWPSKVIYFSNCRSNCLREVGLGADSLFSSFTTAFALDAAVAVFFTVVLAPLSAANGFFAALTYSLDGAI